MSLPILYSLYMLAKWRDITNMCYAEMRASMLPGSGDGPADAYRHVLVSAELTRQFGERFATCVLDAHEHEGRFRGQTAHSEDMDRFNNEVGIRIGRNAASWEEVVLRAREAIRPDYRWPRSSEEGFARWLHENGWGGNPTMDGIPIELRPDGVNIDPRLNWPNGPVDNYPPVRLNWPQRPLVLQRDQLFFPIPKGNVNMITGASGGPCSLLDGGLSYLDALSLTAPETDAPTERIDPLVLDLDGDGIQTTKEGRSWDQGRAFFDHNADGFAERTGWVSANDGLLVMDRNGDGIINNGRELFGSGTALSAGGAAANGFQALADLDSNHDGIINAGDALFSQLRIWKDEDEDGFSFPDELHTLAELGIASISLTPTAPGSGKDAQGNTQNRVGSFTWTDGSTGQIAEYTFATNTAYSIATEWVDVPDDIAALPDLPGYGVVPRLQQAMARDTSGTLKSHVQSFIGATTRAARESALQDILYAWTGSANIDPANGRDGLSGPRVGVLSAFFGQSFFPSGGSMRAVWASSSGVPASYLLPAASVVGAGTGVLAGSSGPWASGWGGATVAPSESYRQIFELMYSQLMAQTHLAGLWNLVAYTWDDTKEQYVSDMTPVISTMMGWFTGSSAVTRQSATPTGPDNGTEEGNEPPAVPVPATRQEAEELLSEFARSIRAFSGQDRVHCLPCREQFIEIDPEFAWVIDTGGLPVIDGLYQGTRAWSWHMEGTDNAEAIRGSLTEGDGVINSQYGNDVVYGTSRNELLINMDGDSLLFAGGGDDTIWAGAGNDILDGGTGNDLLRGDLGNDTYIFRRGSGQDTIIDVDPTEGNIDTIWLGSNLTPDEVNVKRGGNNLRPTARRQIADSESPYARHTVHYGLLWVQHGLFTGLQSYSAGEV